jgi:hypothetical protein
LRKGIPQGEIKNDLVREGFSEEDLEIIFAPHRPDMRSWFLVFAILFLLIGLYNLVVNSKIAFLVPAAVMLVAYMLELKRIKHLRP